MKLITLLIVSWCGLFGILGCQATPRPSPGMAALRVNVVAEPKAGAKPAGESGAGYDGAPGAASYGEGAFERVNYSALDEIVVWAEPSGALQTTGAAPVTIQIDAGKPSRNIDRAVGVGQKLIMRNHGAQPANIYSVSEKNEFDLGSVPAGASAEYLVKSPGIIEILCPTVKDPVAQVYAAPTRWVSLTRAGRSVDFNDLPPGLCRLISWHPRLPGSETSITLSADQFAITSIKVGVNALPKVAPAAAPKAAPR
jgi:hypothetical protein